MRLRPRRLRLYGVGLGKTGTHTLADMFQPHFRSGHEIDAQHLVPVYARYLRGDADRIEVRRELRRRSRGLGLEVDVADFLSAFAGELADLYPRARFILTVRDCFTWFASYIQHVLRDPEPPPYWRDARDARFPRPYDYEPGDAPLERAGVPSVRVGFQRWVSGNRHVLSRVPSDRLLVVRTDDLNRSLETIAAFCGVDAGHLRPAHENPAPGSERLLAQVAPEHLVRVADELCGPLMKRFWGAEWRELVERVGR